jgi:hypothetical protein
VSVPGERVDTSAAHGAHHAPAREVRVETITMALYVAIVLLAESIPLQAYSADAEEVTATYWGSAVGLAVAHVFAFTLTTRALSEGHFPVDARRSAAGQLLAAALVAAFATLPFLIPNEDTAYTVSGSLLALLIGATGFESARAHGSRVPRALIAGAVTLGIAAVVVAVKATIAH